MDDCMICCEPLTVPGASITKCGHVFHTACIGKWFEQKALCPLCKTRAAEPGFTRTLKAPTPLTAHENERIHALAANEPTGTVQGAIERLRAAEAAHMHDAGVCAEARDAERHALAPRRAAVHRLQAELLGLQRELAAAERVEANAAAAAEKAAEKAAATRAREAPGGENDEAAAAERAVQPALPAVLSAPGGKGVSVEAVKQQSRQLAWRCQELRELDEKIDAKKKVERREAKGDTALRPNKRVR